MVLVALKYFNMSAFAVLLLYFLFLNNEVHHDLFISLAGVLQTVVFYTKYKGLNVYHTLSDHCKTSYICCYLYFYYIIYNKLLFRGVHYKSNSLRCRIEHINFYGRGQSQHFLLVQLLKRIRLQNIIIYTSKNGDDWDSSERF